jgi:transformation/transcription domain-associated protein
MVSVDLKVKILTLVIIPSFAVSFDANEGNELIEGKEPHLPTYQEDEENIVNVFINKVIDPERSMDEDDDALRISLLQFACLLVERSSNHIHDSTTGCNSSKKEGSKLRRLMTFAWPCLLAKNFVDPSARYHGHLLLAHIISKLAINKRIVLQVFHSLLKAHAVDARNLVRQALEVITPAMPLRMEDGNQMLTHWTRKIILEEGHSMQQLHHILQLIVRHHKVYYPVRQQLVQQMVSSMNRLGFSPNSSIDYRKLAVELAEVIIKWELQRIKEESDGTYDDDLFATTEKTDGNGAVKRSLQEDEARKKQATGESVPSSSSSTSSVVQQPPSQQRNEDYYRPIDRMHCDSVLNFMFRLACQLGDLQGLVPGIQSPSEALSKRCVALIKRVLDANVWLHTCDLKLNWLDKTFISISTEPIQANISNICTALELLTHLLGCMKREQLLSIFRPLQRGLSVCVTNHNAKIIKMMHNLLTKLMVIFPPEHKHNPDEYLDQLYATISKTIFDGLTQFEKNPKANPNSLFGTLMILKAACTNNQSYIDRLIVPFMNILDRLKKEHIGPNSQQQAQQQQISTTQQSQIPQNAAINTSEITLELLILALDLVKNRVIVMGVDLRKMFIGTILVGLIEKSTEPKVLKAIIKMIEEWMKNKSTPLTVLQAPTLREKSILLVKLMHYVEKRFSDDHELNAQFLELVNYIYRDDQLKVSELTAKLEQAFLAGLRCNQPNIRSKFFEVFDGSMRRKLHDRLLYIVCSHSWDSIQHHYWIKQCIELLLLTTNTTHSQIKNSNDTHLLPSITSVINLADSEEKNNFVIYTSLQPDQHDISLVEDKEDAIDMEMNVDNNVTRREESERPVENRMAVLHKLLNRQADFLDASRKVKTEQFLIASSQLCHLDTSLAESIWLTVFPRLWSILDEGQQQALEREFIPFLSSGTHVIQKDCHPSAINTFVEALTYCQPPVYISPSLMIYLGKSHNLWHRMTLMLENMAIEWPNRRDSSSVNTEYRGEFDFDSEFQSETPAVSNSGEFNTL